MLPLAEAALCLAFALSGAAALLFETLWFRQTGLVLGNGVWATSVTTASFMAGLAAGNGLCARAGGRLRRPLRTYAVLELVIALVGAAVVLGLPRLAPAVAAWAGPLVDRAALLNGLRIVVAFGVLCAPATAMGATLPVLVEGLGSQSRSFGQVVGRLYGWNTAGAVAGALAGELVLVPALGVRGTGLAAAGLDVTGALVALALARFDRPRGAGEIAAERGRPPVSPGGSAIGPWPRRALLIAAAMSGALMLALETIAFRFLLLFVCGTTLAFAAMLAVVLAGISLGAAAAAALLGRRPAESRLAGMVAGLAGAATVVAYARFPLPAADVRPCGLATLAPAAALLLPTALLSGALFTLLAAAVRPAFARSAQAAGAFTLANTLGSLAGALAGGFLLVPRLGVESSFFAVALGYGAVALVVGMVSGAAGRRAALAVAAVLVLLLVLFPFGLMRGRYLPRVIAPWTRGGAHVVTWREGLTETSVYLRETLWWRTVAERLVTNGFSMAGTGYNTERYTKLFAYWPLALRPQARRALLISYGVGSTAAALAGSVSLETIDVVDISRDVFEVSLAARPEPGHPLRDRRVRMHVEDGRQFLLVSRQSFDLITAEPPPPKNAGIDTLYSAEYFALLRERLAPGGVATYWLPVHSLAFGEAMAVTRAFCASFPDCSLWTGFGYEWMLAGTRDLEAAPSEEAFGRQWRDPARARELAALGFESPERLGTTFLADAAQLRRLAGGISMLTDDRPHLLLQAPPGPIDPVFERLMDAEAARTRYAESAWVARAWPPALRARTEAFFGEQGLVSRLSTIGSARMAFGDLARDAGRRRFACLWAIGVNEDVVAAARDAERRGPRGGDPALATVLGADDFASGRWGEAAARFERALAGTPGPSRLALWRALALCRAGEGARAREAIASGASRIPAGDREAEGPLLAECP